MNPALTPTRPDPAGGGEGRHPRPALRRCSASRGDARLQGPALGAQRHLSRRARDRGVGVREEADAGRGRRSGVGGGGVGRRDSGSGATAAAACCAEGRGPLGASVRGSYRELSVSAILCAICSPPPPSCHSSTVSQLPAAETIPSVFALPLPLPFFNFDSTHQSFSFCPRDFQASLEIPSQRLSGWRKLPSLCASSSARKLTAPGARRPWRAGGPSSARR